MASTIPTLNMNLIPWEEFDDSYDYGQLSHNFVLIDQHDHTSGKGVRLTTNSLADGAVTTVKLGDHNVTRSKLAAQAVGPDELADDAVTRPKLADDAVGPDELAEGSVQPKHLDPNVVPIGSVTAWWRPSNAHPIPSGWLPCDGRTLGPSEHDFQGGGTIVLPDLNDDQTLVGGADTAIGQAGGSNSPSVAHVHAVAGHTHTVAHSHTVASHAHSISSDGQHEHGFKDDNGNPQALGSRGIVTATSGGFQALFVPGLNSGQTSTVFVDMDDRGAHSHTGATGAAAPSTSADTPSTSSQSLTTDSALSTVDVRGSFLRVLFIIKVKNT